MIEEQKCRTCESLHEMNYCSFFDVKIPDIDFYWCDAYNLKQGGEE